MVDVTREIGRLISISLHYHPEDEIDPSDRQFIHRFGWGVIAIAGSKMPSDLIDDMLRAKWSDLVRQYA